jgi:transposase
MLLKFLDDMEQVREEESKLAGKKFRQAIEPPYRWRAQEVEASFGRSSAVLDAARKLMFDGGLSQRCSITVRDVGNREQTWRGEAGRPLIPQLLAPVQHRSAQAQADLMVIRARAGLVRARTSLINTARGLTKSYGERLRGCSPRNLNAEKARQLSPELQAALEPLLAAIESLSERIYEYNQKIEKIARESYPQVARLEQVKGVGTLIALTYLLTLEDPQRFRKSRDVGCYVGLQPGRRNSGQSEPQLHISKEGDPYLRTLLVQGAHHILGPFGADSDLRRWGLKLAERGGKNGKKRAVIATARKLAVLLHRLWVSGEAYEPLRHRRPLRLPAAA